MLQTKTIGKGKIQSDPRLFINIIFCLFPLSFFLGNLFLNINLVIFCGLGIYYLRSKILKVRLDFIIKVIFLFFCIIFLSSLISFIKVIYFEGLESVVVKPQNCNMGCYSPLERLLKSILLFRFYLLLIIIYLLNQINILRFKYFFISGAFFSILLSLDLIFQHFFGFNILGIKTHIEFRASGFFGEELIAGGYLIRFGFFTILFIIFTFKDKNYTKFISTVIAICVLGMAIFFTGNRMPVILFLLGLFIIFFSHLKMKKILLVSMLITSILLSFTISSDEKYKIHLTNQYSSMVQAIKNTYVNQIDTELFGGTNYLRWGGPTGYLYTVRYESEYRRLYLTAIDTWKFNKIFGNGLKSFRETCGMLKGDNVSIIWEQFPNKVNRLCSSHPHNYYFEVLTETGILGLAIIFLIASIFIVFVIRNFNLIKQQNINSFILLAAILSFLLEAIPLRSTGSLFTTSNATYIILIGSIILSYKNLLKIK